MPAKRIPHYSKYHGAKILAKAAGQMQQGKPQKDRALVRVLSPFIRITAGNTEELENRIRKAAQKAKCARIFIRGDAVNRVRKKHNRFLLWNEAPRGHFDVAKGTFKWDTRPPIGQGIKNYRFLAYATNAQEEIKSIGTIRIERRPDGKLHGNIFFGGTLPNPHFVVADGKINWIANKNLIEKRGPLGKDITEFIKAINAQIPERTPMDCALDFIQWRGEPGIEFFSFTRDQ